MSQVPAVVPSVPSQSPTSESESSCAVTIANGQRPDAWPEAGVYQGNGKLFTQLWPDGTVLANASDIQANGSISVKFPWYRALAGHLEITGHRLDGSSPPLTAWIPDGYGDIGFQSTAILFPTPGCWEVTGRVQQASLSFVTRIVSP